MVWPNYVLVVSSTFIYTNSLCLVIILISCTFIIILYFTNITEQLALR